MSTNFRSTSLTSKPDNRHSLTPASSLSSVASSKSSDLSSASSRSCSSTNLNYIPAKNNNVKLLGNKKQKATVKIKNSMVVNPVISHHHTNSHQNNHNDHHHIITNRLTRSNSNDHVNPLRFVAHNCLVKCMCLGQTSGEVFASVGNDNQIKLWAIGNTQSLVTLKGRTAIECVQFSRNEEVLATGSLKGSVQIWDLNSKNLFRTFKGHTSTIKCIDFFPSGDFLTSGSSDCTVKLWDSRKSDCVHTYDEHEKSVLCQVFSPDGKWIASGDSDGNIKIWDLTACKKITDLKAHTGAITDIKFHPMVLILVTSSMDGTICFWDLEKFKLISRISANSGNTSSASSGYISSSCSSNRSSTLSGGKLNEITSVNSLNNAIHKVMFHPNGYQLFGIAKDKYLLCDILNEPELNCLVNMNFGIGKDIAFNKTGIVVSGHQQTYISLNLIKWRDLDNFNNYNRHNSANSTSSRRNFDQKQLHQTYLQLELISSKYVDDLKSDLEDNEIIKELNFLPNENVDNGKIFSPKRELTRTPTKSDFENDFMNSANDKTFLIENKTIEQFQKQLINHKNKNQFNQPIKLPVLQNCVQPQPHVLQPQNNQCLTQMPSSNNTNSSHNKLITQTNSTQNRLRNVPKSLSLRNLNKISVVQPVQSKTHQNSLSNNNKLESNHNIYNSKNNFGKITPAAVVFPDSHHPLSNNSISISNLSSNPNYNENLKEINLDNSINKLVPPNCNLQLNSINHANSLSLSLGNLSRNSNTMLNLSSMDLNESQILDDIYHGHQEMEIILNQREISLKFALNTWRNDTNKGFTFANSTQDMTIVAELVKLTIFKQEWNIQKCQSILPQVDNLLRSKQEVCVDAASQALEFIMENFLDLIRQNIAKHPSIGVDISREERCKKSMDCYTQLVSMRAFINKQQCMVGQLGIKFRHLSSLMERIDAKT